MSIRRKILALLIMLQVLVGCGVMQKAPPVIELAGDPGAVVLRVSPETAPAIPALVQPSDLTLLGTCTLKGRSGFLGATNLEIIWVPAGLLVGNGGGTFGLVPGHTIVPGAVIDWAPGQPLINVSAGMKNLTQYAGKVGGGAWDPHSSKVWVAAWEFYNTATRNNLGLGWMDSLLGPVQGAWYAGDPAARWTCTDVPGWNCPGTHFDDVFHANKTSEWVVAVPDWWSKLYAPGKHLGSGRQRPGGSNEGASGPYLCVWDGDPSIPAGGHQNAICVLAYPTGSRTWTGHYKMEGDHTGTGAAWVDTGRKSALIYNWTSPDPASFECYDTFGPSCDNFKGHHATVAKPAKNECAQGAFAKWTPMLYFYDPQDLGAVAQGTMQPWEPQPYASMDISADVGWPICDPTAEGPGATSATWNPAKNEYYLIVVDKKSNSPKILIYGVS